MSRLVELSDALILDARLAGEVCARSIAGQVEFWARLGRAIELLLRGDRTLALCRAAATRPLSQCLNEVDSPEGRRGSPIACGRIPSPITSRTPTDAAS